MRWAELALFLVPFVLYAAWRSSFAMARTALFAVAVGAVLLAAGTVWYGLSRREPAGEAYVPARISDGRIVPGHAVAR